MSLHITVTPIVAPNPDVPKLVRLLAELTKGLPDLNSRNLVNYACQVLQDQAAQIEASPEKIRDRLAKAYPGCSVFTFHEARGYSDGGRRTNFRVSTVDGVLCHTGEGETWIEAMTSLTLKRTEMHELQQPAGEAVPA